MPRAMNEAGEGGSWGNLKQSPYARGKFNLGKREILGYPACKGAGMRFPQLPPSPAIPTAADVLRAAAELGVHLSVSGGFIEWEAALEPPGDFLAKVAAVKPALIEILRGDRCLRCAERLAWPAAAGITFADATSECMACADREAGRLLEAGRRAVKSPDALADPAEVMLRGELT